MSQNRSTSSGLMRFETSPALRRPGEAAKEQALPGLHRHSEAPGARLRPEGTLQAILRPLGRAAPSRPGQKDSKQPERGPFQPFFCRLWAVQSTSAPRNSLAKLSKSSKLASRMCRACRGSVSSKGGGRPARLRARSTWRDKSKSITSTTKEKEHLRIAYQ